ncbi:MAG: hypothetical protein NZL87_06050 [Thermomicrobium sp.]|nr:hypothetical protein [Thermomicrobium sp.]
MVEWRRVVGQPLLVRSRRRALTVARATGLTVPSSLHYTAPETVPG